MWKTNFLNNFTNPFFGCIQRSIKIIFFKIKFIHMKLNKKGFTLIELLVVIAIIGLLATVSIVSLNSARVKSRDAKRLSDVKQLATILEMESTNSTSALEGCTDVDDLTTACTGPGQVSQFSGFADPVTPGTACTSASAGTCGYSISTPAGAGGATVANYQITFYLEADAGSLLAGINCISTGSIMESGAVNCP